jgi:hypothetical protein
MILAIVALAVGVYFNLRGPTPDKMNCEELTRAHMNRVELCILRYQSDKKDWPDVKSWDEQLQPYFAKDSKFFSPSKVVLDGWGNRIKYGVKQEGDYPQPFLYSCGRNGIDDKGTGDDILIEIPQ